MSNVVTMAQGEDDELTSFPCGNRNSQRGGGGESGFYHEVVNLLGRRQFDGIFR
jgi:hypothetical protein